MHLIARRPRCLPGTVFANPTTRRQQLELSSRTQLPGEFEGPGHRRDMARSPQSSAGGDVSDFFLATSQGELPEPQPDFLIPTSSVPLGLELFFPASVPSDLETQTCDATLVSPSNVTQVDPLNDEEAQVQENSPQDNDDDDDDDDRDDAGFNEILDGATHITNIREGRSSSSESNRWVINSTLGNFFSQIFQTPGDEIAFTYCRS